MMYEKTYFGGTIVTLEELRIKFLDVKSYEPVNLNQLMDFLQFFYIKGEISVSNYRNLIQTLEMSGASKPVFITELNQNVEIF